MDHVRSYAMELISMPDKITTGASGKGENDDNQMHSDCSELSGLSDEEL